MSVGRVCKVNKEIGDFTGEGLLVSRRSERVDCVADSASCGLLTHGHSDPGRAAHVPQGPQRP